MIKCKYATKTIDPFHNDVERARPLAKTRQVMFQIHRRQCSVRGKELLIHFCDCSA